MSTFVTKLPLTELYEEVKTLEDYLATHFLSPEQFNSLIQEFYEDYGLKKDTLMNLEQLRKYQEHLHEIYEQIVPLSLF